MKSNISEYDKYLHSLGVGTENITKDSEGIVYCEEYEKYLRTLGIGKGKESGEANKVDLKIKECPWRLVGVEHKGTINTVLQRKNADEKFELAVTYLLGTDGNLNEIVIDKNTRIQIRMANVYDCLIYPQVQDVLERQGGGVKWSTIQNDLACGVVKKHDVVFPVLWVLTINGIPFFDGLEKTLLIREYPVGHGFSYVYGQKLENITAERKDGKIFYRDTQYHTPFVRQ